jgi:hypothetical protein
MNTDDSVIMDYRDALPPRLVDEVRRLIPEVDDEVFERFIKRIRFPVSACRTEQRAHQTIPDAKAISVKKVTSLLVFSPACCVAQRVTQPGNAPLCAPCRQTKILRNLITVFRQFA